MHGTELTEDDIWINCDWLQLKCVPAVALSMSLGQVLFYIN